MVLNVARNSRILRIKRGKSLLEGDTAYSFVSDRISPLRRMCADSFPLHFSTVYLSACEDHGAVNGGARECCYRKNPLAMLLLYVLC
jgi:hypothetical protein